MSEPVAWIWEMNGKKYVDFKNWLPQQLGLPSIPLYEKPNDEKVAVLPR